MNAEILNAADAREAGSIALGPIAWELDVDVWDPDSRRRPLHDMWCFDPVREPSAFVRWFVHMHADGLLDRDGTLVRTPRNRATRVAACGRTAAPRGRSLLDVRRSARHRSGARSVLRVGGRV